MRYPVLLLTVLTAAGCSTSKQADPVIWAGAMQDQNYEIQGKPQAARVACIRSQVYRHSSVRYVAVLIPAGREEVQLGLRRGPGAVAC